MRADHVDGGRVEQNFLMRFAKRGGDRRLRRIDPPAGKGDLSCMGAQMLAADGQDHAGLGAVGDRDQHRGGTSARALEFGQVAGEQAARAAAFASAFRSRSARRHSAVSSGKKVPSLQMPGGSPPSGERELGKLVIDRARELGFEPMADENARRGAVFRLDDPQRMIGAEDHGVAAVEREGDPPVAPFALAVHLDRAEGGATRRRCRASRPA